MCFAPQFPHPTIRTLFISRLAFLASATVFTDKSSQCLQQYCGVQKWRLPLHILYVKTHHVIEGNTSTPSYLPQSGDARLHRKPFPVLFPLKFPVEFHSERDFGPGANKRHLSFQDIKNLWELIQIGLSQDGTQPGHPGVCSELIELFILQNGLSCTSLEITIVVVHVHSSKFVDDKSPTILANPLLEENRVPGRLNPNGYSYYDQQGN